MGHNISNDAGIEDDLVLENLSRDEVIDNFFNNCVLELLKVEIRCILKNVNATSFSGNSAIESNEIPFIFKILLKEQQLDTLNPEFWIAINVLHESLKVLGQYPFLQDYANDATSSLNLKGLLISCIFHGDKYKGIISPTFDYIKLLFISLSLANEKGSRQYEKKENQGQILQEQGKDKIPYVVQLKGKSGHESHVANIVWNSFETIENFDGIRVDELKIKASDLLPLITFFLILSSLHGRIPLLQEILKHQFSEQWPSYHEYSIGILKFFNPNITGKNYQLINISFEEFNHAMNQYQMSFIRSALIRLFNEGLLTSKDTFKLKAPTELDVQQQPNKKHVEFVPSKMVNESSIAVISSILEGKKSNIIVSKENLIKLYAGSEAGFSIRSLELKVFKWQAPTLLLVSGKRVKDKTIKTNTRYQRFDEEYPTYFRSNEKSTMEWQGQTDRICYAVVINLPWRHSNKKNFGDENSMIINLLPRLDSYASIHNTILNGELIYFNNTGMGLGFGNEQPINKNGVKKYLPGTVSLTIEANLEFAIFRHISSPNKNSVSFFQTSRQKDISNDDFEDRFLITDLEVWGIGSTKELEEQRKQWEWEEKQAEARKGVNLKNLGEERAFLEMVGLVGNNNSSGGSV